MIELYKFYEDWSTETFWRKDRVEETWIEGASIES
jgi:hypothetical protein